MTQAERSFRHYHKSKLKAALKLYISLRDSPRTAELQQLFDKATADVIRHKTALDTGARRLYASSLTSREALEVSIIMQTGDQMSELSGFDFNEWAKPEAPQALVIPELTPEREAQLERLGQASARQAADYTDSITETPEERRKRKLAEAKAADDQVLRLVDANLGKKDDQL